MAKFTETGPCCLKWKARTLYSKVFDWIESFAITISSYILHKCHLRPKKHMSIPCFLSVSSCFPGSCRSILCLGTHPQHAPSQWHRSSHRCPWGLEHRAFLPRLSRVMGWFLIGEKTGDIRGRDWMRFVGVKQITVSVIFVDVSLVTRLMLW